MKRFATLSILALPGVLALACGSEPSEPAPAPQSPPAAEKPMPPATPPPSAPADDTVRPDAQGVVHITGNDQLQYNLKRFEVKSGQRVVIEFKNIGAQPRNVIGHNVVILAAGESVDAFAAEALTHQANDYIPPDAGDRILAHTKLLAGGESDTIEFTAPAPGTYPFLCSFPGHSVTMRGEMVVR
jgi:azurin